MNEHVPSNPFAPDIPNLQLLQTAFGSALVPLGSDVLCRVSLALGEVPLDASTIANDEQLSPSKPAGVVCGGKTGLLALGFAPEPGKHFLTTLSTWLPVCYRIPPNQDSINLCLACKATGDSAMCEVPPHILARFEPQGIDERQFKRLFPTEGDID